MGTVEAVRSETTVVGESGSVYPDLVRLAVHDELIFRPAPPGDVDSEGNPRLRLPLVVVEVEPSEEQVGFVSAAVSRGALTTAEVDRGLMFAGVGDEVRAAIAPPAIAPGSDGWRAELEISHELDRLGLVAVELIDQMQKQLLGIEPLSQIQFRFSPRAKAVLMLAWLAIAKRGEFPIGPKGEERFQKLDQMPCGALHFVSASDRDAGYLYTMGVAQSPEAQALGTMDTSFGLDGELIVPGQAVSPIPPFLSLSTRLFAASIPTSSNISEEVQSIPNRSFAHPAAIDDLEPRRGGRLKPAVRPRNSDEAITDLRMQLARFHHACDRRHREESRRPVPALVPDDPVGAAYDVTGMTRHEIVTTLDPVLSDPGLARDRRLIALYLDVEVEAKDRIGAVCTVIDAARLLDLRYVALADEAEDSWLPNLLEYLEPAELNEIAEYSDAAGVIVLDGRPVDPVYTAATAAQRIQAVYSTLSVDILKMGMWLCLDALAARRVWHQILGNPHIPQRMLLMPIGIVEPWNAFVDNRDETRTARAILDPFEKIKFMIEEAAALGMPSLLTDTRHKATWVLLGRKAPEDEPHVRERFVTDGPTGEILGRTSDSAIPLLTWSQFMECERLARKNGILLGQAGSIEVDQGFRIISETTYDAAKAGRNPATAFWTAETERVLRVGQAASSEDLQTERSSDVQAFLAVVNRGGESHAKLDGWLRYLADIGRGEPALREDLENRYAELTTLLERCLASQRHDPARYQADWDAYRAAYVAYHTLIRETFDRVRGEVADAWRQRRSAQ